MSFQEATLAAKWYDWKNDIKTKRERLFYKGTEGRQLVIEYLKGLFIGKPITLHANNFSQHIISLLHLNMMALVMLLRYNTATSIPVLANGETCPIFLQGFADAHHLFRCATDTPFNDLLELVLNEKAQGCPLKKKQIFDVCYNIVRKEWHDAQLLKPTDQLLPAKMPRI